MKRIPGAARPKPSAHASQDRAHSIEQGARAAKPLLPTLSVLLAAALWGVFWYPLRLLEAHGLSGLWSTLLIYSGTLAAAAPLLRHHLHESVRAPGGLLVLALAAGWCNTAFVLAMLHGEVMRVLLLFFLSPIWATLLGRWLLGERVSGGAWLTLLLALAGAVVMLWGPAARAPSFTGAGDWLALSAGLTFALTNTMVRRIQNVALGVKTVAAWLGGILFAGALILVTGDALAPAGAGAILAALGFGAVVMVVMTLSVQYGVTHMPVHRSAVIVLFELVAGALSSQLLTSERMARREWIGGALIVAAAYFTASRNLEGSDER